MALNTEYWVERIKALSDKRKLEERLKVMRGRGLDPDALMVREESIKDLPEWLTDLFPVGEIVERNFDVHYVGFYRSKEHDK